MEILRRNGLEGLTTTAVTRQAGFTQSAFYVHFASLDECLAEVARQTAARIRAFVDEDRRRAHQEPVGWETLAAHFRAMLELFRQERTFSELFLRHRREGSTLGKVMRRLHRELCDDLTVHWQTAMRAGGVEAPTDRLALHAELILAQVYAGGEAVLDRRCTPERVAEELTRFVMAAAQAVMEATSD